jgi:sugar/nucleoside kinase (ribokinase family)
MPTTDGVTPIPARAAHAVDTSSAGDAFHGAFALDFTRGVPAQRAIGAGVVAATAAVQRHGAQP